LKRRENDATIINRQGLAMLFMVIERFGDRDPIPVYGACAIPGSNFPKG
jgi:hypothetical protein